AMIPGQGGQWRTRASFSRDRSVTAHEFQRGTIRRIGSYARRYQGWLIVFVLRVLADAAMGAAVPLIYRTVIDDGILGDRRGLIVGLALVLAALAILSALNSMAMRWYSARIGEQLIYDLRTDVFDHVQRMPIGFFSRAQTGTLVTRLNNDVQGA